MQTLESFITFIRSVDSTFDITTISDITIAIQILDELLDTHPKTIAKKIDQLIELQLYLLQHLDQSQLLQITHLYDFIVGVVTKYPKLIINKKIRCQKILRGAIEILSHIEDSLTQQWMNPTDGMSKDDLYSTDADMQVAHQIMSSFDALVQLLGQKSQLTQFQKIFREYIERGDDWRIQYAALMIASQLGQDLLEIDQLGIYAEWAIKMLGHSHPKVKYASLQLLGQYSNDAKPEFQQKYFDILTPILIQMLHDPIPKVVSHTLACITNLFEGYGETGKIQNYIGQILPPIFTYLTTGSSWLKQNCLSVLAAISSVKNAFGPNLPQVFESVNSLLSTYTQQPFHRQLLNQCFQTMSFLLTCQSKDYIHQCIPLFAQALILNRDKIDISYFMHIWIRSCEQELFVQVVDVELVYKYIIDRIDFIFKEQGDQDSLLTINCLIKTAKVFKLRVQTFREPTLILAKAILHNKQLSDDIRQQAVNLMTTFIESIQSYSLQQYNIWLLTSTQTFQYLLSCVDNVFLYQLNCFQTIQWLLSGIKQLIIELHKAMSLQEIKQFVEKLATYQKQIEKCYTTELLKKVQIQNEEYDDELGEEDTPNKIIQTDIDCLVNGLQAIPIIFSQLLKTNNQQVKQWLIGHLITQIDFFINNKIVDWKHYGLSIIITLIEACNSSELAVYWSSLMMMLSQCSSDPSPRIRNQGAYGMGEIFTKTPLESIRDDDIIGWMHQLWSALTTPYSDSQHLKKQIKHCEDNVISALGKLLKRCGPAFSHILDESIYRKWASYLPLNNDKLEGNQQQLFLVEILDSGQTLLVKNGNDLKSICEIYAKFISRRSEKEYAQIIRLTKQSLFRIKGWPIFIQCGNFLWSNLSSTHISALTRLMNS